MVYRKHTDRATLVTLTADHAESTVLICVAVYASAVRALIPKHGALFSVYVRLQLNRSAESSVSAGI